jgi:hypothetical protein
MNNKHFILKQIIVVILWVFITAIAYARSPFVSDFESRSDAHRWNPLGGQWAVVNGEYVGGFDMVQPPGQISSC